MAGVKKHRVKETLLPVLLIILVLAIGVAIGGCSQQEKKTVQEKKVIPTQSPIKSSTEKKQDEYSNKESYATLQDQYNELKSEYDTLQSKYNSLKESYATLQDQYNELKQIANLEKSDTLVASEIVNQPEDSYTKWTFYLDYPGYIEVNVKSSTTTKTYVMCWYDSYGVSYKQRIDVGDSGIACFPVLPGTVYVAVGNYNLLSGATETVSVTYYY